MNDIAGANKERTRMKKNRTTPKYKRRRKRVEAKNRIYDRGE